MVTTGIKNASKLSDAKAMTAGDSMFFLDA